MFEICCRMSSFNSQNWYTEFLYPVQQHVGPRSAYSNYGGVPYYPFSQFLFIQQQVVSAIINNGETESILPTIYLNRYPNPKWLNDPFYGPEMSTVVVILIMISFMYNYVNTIRAITIEKEKQLKESMKIMGLPGWLHWLAWFARTFLLSLMTVVFMVIVVKINFKTTPIFSASDGSVLFIFLLLFVCCNITFAFLVSVFFSKGKFYFFSYSCVFQLLSRTCSRISNVTI